MTDLPTIYTLILTALLGLLGYFSRHWATTTEKAVEKAEVRINNLKDVVVEIKAHVQYMEHQHENMHGDKPFAPWEQKIF